MEKRKITAREVVQEVRSGKNDKALMDKYNLSAQGLQSLFDKLVTAGALTQEELDERVPMNERTVDLGLFICPACGNIQSKEFVKCPRCAFSVKRKDGEASQPGRMKSTTEKNPASVRLKSPKLLDEPQPKPQPPLMEPDPIDADLGLIRMVNYCRFLSIAAVITYAVAVFGLLSFLLLSPGSKAVESVVGVIALGVPAIAISAIVFVSLRVLTEAVKIFSSLSAPMLKNSGRGN